MPNSRLAAQLALAVQQGLFTQAEVDAIIAVLGQVRVVNIPSEHAATIGALVRRPK